MSDAETKAVQVFSDFVQDHCAKHPGLEIDTELLVDIFHRVLKNAALKKGSQLDLRDTIPIGIKMLEIMFMMPTRWALGESPREIRAWAMEEMSSYCRVTKPRAPATEARQEHPLASQNVLQRPIPTLLPPQTRASVVTQEDPQPRQEHPFAAQVVRRRPIPTLLPPQTPASVATQSDPKPRQEHPFAAQVVPRRPIPTLLPPQAPAPFVTQEDPVLGMGLSDHTMGPGPSGGDELDAFDSDGFELMDDSDSEEYEPVGAFDSDKSEPAQATSGGVIERDSSGRRPELSEAPLSSQAAQKILDEVSQSRARNDIYRLKVQADVVRALIREKYPTSQMRRKHGKLVCPICKQGVRSTSLDHHIFNHHRQMIEENYIPRNTVVLPEFHCRYPGCTSRVKVFHRKHIRETHESTAHGIDIPKMKYTTHRKYIDKKSIAVLRDHIIADGTELNSLKDGILEAERRLAEWVPNYQSRHGLDLDTRYETDPESLPVTKPPLVDGLISLRTDGLKKGKLLCQPGAEGPWEIVLADLEEALERVQKGQTLD